MSYHTNNRKLILEFLEKNSNRMVSAADIYQFLCTCGNQVNITTIYRFLNKLESEKRVIRYSDDSSKLTVFQYVPKDNHCENHLHLKCTNCGRVYHLDCDFMQEISEHILSHHGFMLQCKNSVLYGLCQECQQHQNEKH